MAVVLDFSHVHQQKHGSPRPDLKKCKNPFCSNLISNVNQKSRERIFCSPKCRYKVHRMSKQDLSPRTCRNQKCRKTFVPNHGKRLFCSWDCYIKAKNMQVRSCAICKTFFDLTRDGQRKYCSLTCRKAGSYAILIRRLGFKVEVLA